MKAEERSPGVEGQIIHSCLFVLLLIVGLVSHPAAAKDFLYVNNNARPNAVSAFKVGSDGSLTPVPGAPFPTGGSGGFCFDVGSTKNIHRHGGFLYATNYASHNVSGFSINNDGSLTPVPGSPFPTSPGGNPVGVASSADQQLLFVGHNFLTPPVAGIDVYQINPDGSLTLVPGSPFGVAQGDGFDVLFNVTDHTVISDVNRNEVAVFSVTNDGALTPIPGSPFTTPTFNDQQMALGPQHSCLYVAGGRDPRVSAMQIFDDGSLANAPGSPVATGQSLIVGAATTQQGNFAYFAGFPNITGYHIDNACQMTPIPGSPFANGSETTGITTEGNGKFLYAVNFDTRSVNSFQIAPDGSLTLEATAPLQGVSFCPTGLSAYPVIGH